MKKTRFPRGWNEKRVHRVLDHYERQTDEQAANEDQAAYESTTHTFMKVPVKLVPRVRELIARQRSD